MSLVSRYRTQFDSYLLKEDGVQSTITVFCKSLYGFLVLKIIFLWPVLSGSQRYFPFEFTTGLQYGIYAPIKFAQYDLTMFIVSTLVLLVLGLVLKINYVTSALIFWLSFNLSRLAQPVVNGSDYVLNLFLFLSIFLSTTPVFKPETLRNKQMIISNFVFLFCKIQLVLIYLLSGFDKLTSSVWRSGDAIYAIINLEFFMNPHVTIPTSKTLYLLIAWAIILFELTFPLLIWFKRLRVYALMIGIIFHVAIMFVLSLPDFGLVMILMYSLFIPFRNNPKPDYESSLR